MLAFSLSEVLHERTSFQALRPVKLTRSYGDKELPSLYSESCQEKFTKVYRDRRHTL